jgi:hypothetical protein
MNGSNSSNVLASQGERRCIGDLHVSHDAHQDFIREVDKLDVFARWV